MQSWAADWWSLACFGALMIGLALSPGSYGPNSRRAIAQQIVAEASTNLLWFILLFSLISLMLIRIVVVTASSYGVSEYALEMVVRVLVLELIPLGVSMFAALRSSVPGAGALSDVAPAGQGSQWRDAGIEATRREFFSRTVAYMFTVVMFACTSCVLAMVFAYLSMYGLTPWAIGPYTRVVGQVFSPVVTTIFVVKTLALSAAVTLIPLAPVFYGPVRLSGRSKTAAQLAALVRLFFVILVIEVASLVGNYS
ncbi:MAG: hypothetical protein NVSMB6_20060 [Burkholderiaceae bacterium]